MRQIKGKNVEEISVDELLVASSKFSRVVFDLGCGDGRFAYDQAKSNPDTLVIAVDADKSQMLDVSAKSQRKPEKGGLENVIYIWSAVETLPAELSALADVVYINFPWGVLLAGVMKPDPLFLKGISTLLKLGGQLQILTSYDRRFEPQTIDKMGLEELTPGFIQGKLADSYRPFQLELITWKLLSDERKLNLHGTWPKKLHQTRQRSVYEVLFMKIDQ